MKNTKQRTALSLIITLILGSALYGCGGGGSNSGVVATTAPSVVSGVAATGAPMIGTVYLKDSANSPEMSTTLTNQGAFLFDVSGKTAPYMLRAGSLYSMRSGAGTANINPMSTLVVSEMGGFSNMSSMNTFYRNPSSTTMQTMYGNMNTAMQHLWQKMGALMSVYGVANTDPITGLYNIGLGMDRMFDDMKMTIDSTGKVTMMYANGTPVFIGKMEYMMDGSMMTVNIVTPSVTPATSGITITPSVAKMQVNGTQQFTANIPVTWSLVTSGSMNTTSGLYTAPTFQGMFMVKATSIADPTKSAIASVQTVSMGMTMGMM